MPSSDLHLAVWFTAATFMALHIAGTLALGWTTAHPSWWLALAWLLSGIVLGALERVGGE